VSLCQQVPPGYDEDNMWQPSYLNLNVTLNKTPKGDLQVRTSSSALCDYQLLNDPPFMHAYQMKFLFRYMWYICMGMLGLLLHVLRLRVQIWC
jgi:hypothetical protein